MSAPMPWHWWRPEHGGTTAGRLAILAMELSNTADAIGPVPDLAERVLREHASHLAEFAERLREEESRREPAPFYRIHVHGEPDRYVHRFPTFEEAQQVLDAIDRRGFIASYDEHGKVTAQYGAPLRLRPDENAEELRR